MTTAAIVVTHNNASTIKDSIKSLQAQGITQITIIDNASTDNTRKKGEDLSVVSIKNEKNTGFASAVNQGVVMTESEYILLINPDAQLMTPIESALQHFQKHTQVGVIGFELQDHKGQPEAWSYGEEVTLLSLLTRRQLPSSSKTCDWVSGGAMMIRRKAFNSVNGFAPEFFMYWEDVDFCRRAMGAGWNVVRLPEIKVLHHRGLSTTSIKEKTKMYDASADIYFRKHYSTIIWASQHLLRRIYRFFWRQVH